MLKYEGHKHFLCKGYLLLQGNKPTLLPGVKGNTKQTSSFAEPIELLFAKTQPFLPVSMPGLLNHGAPGVLGLQ